MLLEGVNFDEFKREGGDNTLSPKKKTTVVERGKRKRRRKRRMIRKESIGEEQDGIGEESM